MVQFLESKERAEELHRSSEAAAKSVELVRIQYKEGEVDFGRVFVLESALVQRQDQLVATEAEVAIALVRLYKALGGGWQLRLSAPYCGRYPVGSIASNSLPVNGGLTEPVAMPLELPSPERNPDRPAERLDLDDAVHEKVPNE